MLIPHKGHTDTIQVYSVTVMTHVKALQAGHSIQGTSEPITPVLQGYILQGYTNYVFHKQVNTSYVFHKHAGLTETWTTNLVEI